MGGLSLKDHSIEKPPFVATSVVCRLHIQVDSFRFARNTGVILRGTYDSERTTSLLQPADKRSKWIASVLVGELRSILRRLLLNVIDHQNRHGSLLKVKLKTELLVDRPED